MANDLIPSGGGELTTTEWQTPFAPPTTVDFVAGHGNELTPGGAPVYFFGAPVPGASLDQVQYVVGEIANAFLSDAPRLGISNSFGNQAAAWFRSNALLALPKEWPNHRYNLQGFNFGSDQDTVTAFLNYAYACGASQAEIEKCLWWVNELGKLGNATPASSPRSIDDLSDAEYAQLERINDRAREKGEAELRRAWGYSYSSNLAIVARFVDNLPQREREAIENDMLSDGTMALSHSEVILHLYSMAIGVTGNLGGAALSKRIDEIEDIMRRDPDRYWRDQAMQLELRELYSRRG